MPRAFDPQTLIQLPVMDVGGAAALGEALATAAAGQKKLPAPIARARGRLAAAAAKLKKTIAGRVAPPGADSPRARAADRREDAICRALFTWLSGWALIPDPVDEAETARTIRAALFSEGLKFTQLPYKLEWSEVEARVTTLSEKKLDAKVAKLGGARFLTVLRAAHADYGAALGITAAPPTPEKPALRKAFDAFAAALRTYVLKVAAHVEEDNPATAKLAAALLLPLTEWPKRARSAADKPADDEKPKV